MRDPESAVRAALFPGTVAAVLSSAVLTACGWIENRRALAPHNGPSQWVYGVAAGYRRKPTLRHTLPGFCIHHASSIWWALVQQVIFPLRRPPRSLGRHLAEGGAMAALAGFVDYGVVPERLQPGFENHVSLPSLVAAYVAFGAGLGLATWLLQRKGRSGRV